MIKSFVIGTVAGAAVMWLYGDRIRDYIDDVTMNVRERAAAGLEGAAERLQTVADTVEDGLSGAARRAS
ncbi:MAG TPA: YtxH domain-containing protein [Methylomirabilota bacterium]|nr:YtxH domain-containing protein [Methylomirabilota bacterium]